MNVIDISDESLVRWHFTNIAEQVYGWTRKESELFFRDSYDWVMKKLRKADTRDAQLTAIHTMIELIEDEMRVP